MQQGRAGTFLRRDPFGGVRWLQWWQKLRRFRGNRASPGYIPGLNDVHDTFGCQFTNAPCGFSFQAHTCSV